MSPRTLRSLAVLAAVTLFACSAASEPAFAKSGGNKNKLTLWLLSTGVDTDATAKVTFESKNSGDELRLELRNLPVGTYEFTVSGVVQAACIVKNDNSGNFETKGQLRFNSKKGLPLTFDPTGQAVAVVQGPVTFFSDTVPSTIGPIPDTELKLDLNSTGVIPGGSGDAEAKLRNGRTDFSVEIEDVPTGDYDLRINGVSVATITASKAAGRSSIQGAVEFSSDVDEVGHLPLTFDPHGALIEVFQGASLLFSLAFPAVF